MVLFSKKKIILSFFIFQTRGAGDSAGLKSQWVLQRQRGEGSQRETEAQNFIKYATISSLNIICKQETVLTLVTEDATATGSAFGINKGVYFIRGLFIDVPTSSIILDPYSNKPSYRVGLEIIEDVINANDDSSLYDNG